MKRLTMLLDIQTIIVLLRPYFKEVDNPATAGDIHNTVTSHDQRIRQLLCNAVTTIYSRRHS